ncbi:CHAD domain-containing protein [Streptomyces althioticus]|uniref:CHAD domain-containing protein n=1 Tax=Streptomyces althioticus TaxID=83380 RepID=UPI0033CE8B8F|nr:CHAD domain-containing protein [Streptomyces althioticus]
MTPGGAGVAQRHPDPVDVLARHLRARATEFLRALRLHRDAATPEDSAEAARALGRAARRIGAGLYTFRPALDPSWSRALGPELAWVSGTLSQEDACATRLTRLLEALHHLSGPGAPTPPSARRPTPSTSGVPLPADATPPDAPRPATSVSGTPAPARATGALPAAPRRAPAATATVPAPDGRRTVAPRPEGGSGAAPGRAPLAVGAAKAAALLERQLTLARTRAHSAALRALGSARFHAVADQVAVLAGEVPLAGEAGHTDLRPLADAARERLEDAVAALPLLTAGSPYNAEALVLGLSPDPSPHPQDAPWHQVRLLLRLHRYAQEVLDPAAGDDPRLRAAGEALDRHRDAAEAAAAAAQAGRTPRIAPATAYALGVLHAGQRHEVEAARYAFQRAWQQPPAGTP